MALHSTSSSAASATLQAPRAAAERSSIGAAAVCQQAALQGALAAAMQQSCKLTGPARACRKHGCGAFHQHHSSQVPVALLLPPLLLARRQHRLKLLVTSATLDGEKFSAYFNDCPVRAAVMFAVHCNANLGSVADVYAAGGTEG